MLTILLDGGAAFLFFFSFLDVLYDGNVFV